MRQTLSRNAVPILIGWACAGLLAAPACEAQSKPVLNSVLVVVEDSDDALWVQRIGGDRVRAERLFAPESGTSPADYEACNDRVLGLLEFDLYVARDAGCCSAASFWRERLMRENPLGKLSHLSQSHSAATVHFRVRQAIEVHRVLVSHWPEHKAAFGENLAIELKRLASRHPQPVQFTVSE